MQQLHEKIGEAINLGVRHDDEIVPTYLVWPLIGSGCIPGRSDAPLHLTSLGKLFLAADSS